MITPLIPVKDWVWNRYKVEFLRGEDGPVVRTMEFIGTRSPKEMDYDPEYGGFPFPRDATHFRWELFQENVGGITVTRGPIGMVVTGDGWKEWTD